MRLSPPRPDNGTDKRERSSAPRWPRRSGRCGAARGLRPLRAAQPGHSAMARPDRGSAAALRGSAMPGAPTAGPRARPAAFPAARLPEARPRPRHRSAQPRAGSEAQLRAGSAGSRSAARHHCENGALRRAKKYRNGKRWKTDRKKRRLRAAVAVLTERSRFCSKACLLAKSISLSNCIYIHSTEHTSHAKPCPVHSTRTGPILAFCSPHSEPLSLVISESGVSASQMASEKSK